MNHSTEYREILCASLLHDTGKLIFRTKTQKGNHSQLGEFFYNEYISAIAAFKDFKNVPNMILTHHDKGDSKNAIIAEADHLSADERESSNDVFTLTPLKSVFAGIKTPDVREVDRYFYYRPSSLDSDSLYPLSISSQDDLKKDEKYLSGTYTAVLNNLKEDLLEIRDIEDFDAAVDSLVSVLEKHLSLIPSAGYKSIPDISLYDHMRMTSAIATCMYAADNIHHPFMLIEGDISGIQDYIYSINNSANKEKNMAKRLRGRSFEISLITDAVISYILRELELNRVHIVFAGGGNFILLAPATEDKRQKLLKADENINRFLIRNYSGRIGLVLASHTLDKEGMKDFSAASSELKYKTGQQKNRKYRSILSDEFFGPHDFTEDASDICPVCGRDYEKGSGDCCSGCERQIKLGEKLVTTGINYRATKIVRVYTETGKEIEGADITFSGLGMHYYLTGKNEIPIPEAGIRRVDYISLNNPVFNVKGMKKRPWPSAYSFMFAGTHVPVDGEGAVMTFEDIAGSRKDAYPNLGVMRLDVDDLGFIFSSGGSRSISRFSTLSRSMNSFFLWYVNDIAEKHKVYITYSGGDDLFVTGNWKDVIEFALALHDKFSEYTCGNEAFTLSAGIGIFRHNYPVRFAAEATGKLEQISKGTWFDNSNGRQMQKNAVTLFGTTVSWKRLKELYSLSGDIYELLDSNTDSPVTDSNARIKASLIYRIYSMTSAMKRNGKVLSGDWVPQMRYMLKYIISRRGMGASFMDKGDLKGDMARKQAIAKTLIRDDILRDFSIPGSVVIYSARSKNGG